MVSVLTISIVLLVVGILWAALMNESPMGGMMEHHSAGTMGAPIGSWIAIIGAFLIIL